MKIHVPTTIESAEQAEALPDGTIIIHADYYPQEKVAGLWGREGNSSASLAEEEGWTALVPVEVEERTETRRGWLVRTPGGVRLQVPYQGRPEDSLTDSEEPQEYTTTRWATGWRKTS